MTKQTDDEIRAAVEIIRLKLDEIITYLDNRSLKDGGTSPWITGDLSVPHGTVIEWDYKGRRYSGIVDDGAVVVSGEMFKSAKAIVSHFAFTDAGETPGMDGWRKLWGKFPHEDKFKFLNDLRKKRKVVRER